MPYHPRPDLPRAGTSRLISASIGIAAGLGASSAACADFVYSGVVSIDIPSSADGLFIDLHSGTYGSSRDSIAGWDLNIYGVGTMMLAGQGEFGFMAGGGSSGELVDNLQFRTEIGSGSSFAQGPLGIETSGSSAFNFNSSQNLVGFRFRSETGQYHYGWMRLQLSGSDFGQPKAVFEYLWESTPGTWTNAGVIPAPGALALLGSVPCLFVSRRRRL